MHIQKPARVSIRSQELFRRKNQVDIGAIDPAGPCFYAHGGWRLLPDGRLVDFEALAKPEIGGHPAVPPQPGGGEARVA
jgi:hypothetical protein